METSSSTPTPTPTSTSNPISTVPSASDPTPLAPAKSAPPPTLPTSPSLGSGVISRFSPKPAAAKSFSANVNPRSPPPTPLDRELRSPRQSDDDHPKRRPSRRLQKKRRVDTLSPTMEMPERLRESDPEDEEDSRRPPYINMNQSIFGLIAAAGSAVNFNDRFEAGSSDDEDDDGESEPSSTGATSAAAAARGRREMAHTFLLNKRGGQLDGGTSPNRDADKSRRRKPSGSRLLRSLPTLSLPKRLSSSSRKGKDKGGPSPSSKARESHITEGEESESAASTSTSTGPSPAVDAGGARTEGRLPPVMSRMLEAKAELSARPSFDLDRASGSGQSSPVGGTGDTGPTPLARKLMEIFEFDKPEEVIDEYPCWLLQSVLLQGYMYITANHICFYAYLPKKAHEVAKSGYLSKSGKRNPKYNRYWFRLKGDVLAYYRDPNNVYFPSGQIDLRYGISASVTDRDKDGVNFSVVTHQRTYHFRADSAPSATDWVKSLQRVIFRSHNEGDSVKISLPIANVMDVEEMQVVQFAETCKIRVIDNDETYAIDEYFFSFFSFGKEAINVIKILTDSANKQNQGALPRVLEDSGDEGASNELSSKRSSMTGSRERTAAAATANARSHRLNDAVRATLSPLGAQSPPNPSPRASGDFSRSSFDAFRNFGRRSLDLNQAMREESRERRSFSGSRHARSRSRNRLGGGGGSGGAGAGGAASPIPEKQGSSDSYVQSLNEDPSQASQASLSALVASSISEDQSASQILRGSDVFHSPTIRASHRDENKSPVAGKQKQAVGGGQAKHPHPHHQHHHSLPQSPVPLQKKGHAATTGHIADPAVGEKVTDLQTQQQLTQSPGLTSLPLRGAGALAGYLGINRPFKRMSNLLATESMGYVEKVSGMWKGGRRHYDDPTNQLKPDDEAAVDEDDDEKVAESMERFRQHFALPSTEKLQATYFGHMMRVLPLYGKIYISDRHFCFRSLLPGTRTKLILPLHDVENASKEKGFRFGYSGLVVVIKGHEELFFEFSEADIRDDCAITLLQNLEASRFLRESGLLGQEERADAEAAVAERDALQEARLEERPEHEVPLPRQTSVVSDSPTILFDDPRAASFLNFKPPQPLRITCLTIGSRGDVQPYIALAKGLLKEGHEVRIATHAEFEPWIRSHGIGFARVEGDPGQLMQLCIENGTFTFQFLRVAASKFRGWLDELLASCWDACQGSDLLIESPSAMAGVHVAEALQIPYFRAFTMPWTRTRAYPHAFVMPEHKMGGAYNYVTYVMFENMFWKMTAQQVNRWRNHTLGLPNTSLEKMQANKIPFLYNFSPYVVPPPLDYSDWIRVTGYWFLDEGQDGQKWTPPKELTDFIAKARRDGKKLVYVGFGSIIVPDPAKMTQEVIDAVLKSDVRCVLSKGWSDRMSGAAGVKSPPTTADSKDSGSVLSPKSEASATPTVPEEPVLPPEILQIKSAPHDWLFAQMDAAAHHGGSGTTGASLRAGIPTIIRPFFGDQHFFGSRVEDLGVGIALRKWGANAFARALWEATNSERMVVKARVLGEQIRRENGVETAIQCIYRDLDYARSLVLAKAGKNAKLASRGAGKAGASEDEEADADDEAEEWTFVGGNIPADDDASGSAAGAVSGVEDKKGSFGAEVRSQAKKEARKSLGSRVLGAAA